MLAAALACRARRRRWRTIRQGYQTNMWGMPTYYLLRSGLLEKRGIKVEEFAVPSGNLTMQQMVARQVDLGTYAGPSFIIGHDKGGLVAIAMIEYVGRTARIVARKDLNITKVEQLRGLKIANQTGSSIGNIFVDSIAPKAGLKKGDFQEVRMNVNDMVAALVAKTVDAMVNVEPYNEIAEADGIGTSIMDFSSVDKMPVFMAATPDFVDKNADTVVAYLKAWHEVARDFKQQPGQGRRRDLRASTPRRATRCRARRSPRRWHASTSIRASRRGSSPTCSAHAEVLLREKKISAIPDWKKALRPDFMGEGPRCVRTARSRGWA